MMTQGLELTDQVPFKDVLVHGIVRDSQGRKMSKTLGNGVDPLEVIEKYGTDSLRMSLILGTTPGNDIRYSDDKVETSSNFANKLWNASKFVLMQLEDVTEFKQKSIEELDFSNIIHVDKWIISKQNKLIKEVTENIEKYDLGVAAQKDVYKRQVLNLKNRNKQEFEKLLIEYVRKFFASEKYWANPISSCNTLKDKLVHCISTLWLNATPEDFENPIQFIQRYINFLQDNTFDELTETVQINRLQTLQN